jgi:RNA recognition motif-containing protein
MTSETLKALGVFYVIQSETGDYAMGKKIFVANISFKATEDDLKEIFSKVGEIESVNIVADKHTGQRKGFGFIEMTTEEDAQKAIETLNGTTFMERTLSVAEAKPQSRERRGFKGGRGDFSGKRWEKRGRR